MSEQTERMFRIASARIGWAEMHAALTLIGFLTLQFSYAADDNKCGASCQAIKLRHMLQHLSGR